MRFIIQAVALLVFALPAGLGAQAQQEAPSCRATLDGDLLTTAIEFPDGYTVEAPWRVTWNRAASLEDGRPGVVASARLDRIVETNASTGQRSETPFPEPITTTFEGHTEEELVYRAAQVWCLTVLKAQQREHGQTGQRPADRPPPATRTVGP